MEPMSHMCDAARSLSTALPRPRSYAAVEVSLALASAGALVKANKHSLTSLRECSLLKIINAALVT